MKKQYNKLVCGTIIVSLITISLTGCGLKERDVASSVETERLTEVVSEGLKGSSIKSGKDETVYVSLNQDGSVDNITVTDVLKNFEGGEVQDQSDLCEIQNVKGDEVYKVNGNKILWDYTGSNITYQGKATNELPIGVTITYELDGKEIPLDKVAGTSGKLRIIYEFENNTASKKSESVPFLIASGLILSKTKCTDVIIDHGKVIEEGNNYIVVGYAMPGVLDSMESFEIDMTVQDYEQDMGLLIALPDVLNELPIEDINIEEISSKVDELSDVSNQLVDGTEVIDEGVGKLKDGSSDLKVGGNSLVSGMKDTKEGAFQAKKGSSDIKLGAKDLNDATMKLVKGSKRIQNGANDIKDNLKVLSEGTVKAELGSKQVSEGLTTLKNSLATFKTSSETAFAGISSLATGAKGVDDAVAGLVSGATTIDSSLSTIASGLKTVDSYMTNSENGLVTGSNVVALGVDALIDTFKSSVSSIGEQQKAIMDNVAVQTGIKTDAELAQLLLGMDSTKESYAKLAEAHYSYVALEQVRVNLESLLDQKEKELKSLSEGANKVAAGIGELSSNITTLATGANSLQEAGTGALVNNLVTLKAGSGTLLTGANALNTGVTALSGGVTQFVTAVNSLESGAGQLYAANKTINNGVSALYTGSKDLSTGATTLYDGLTSVKNGTSKLYSGTKVLNTGLGNLYVGTNDLYIGGKKLEKGIISLKDGVDILNDGTTELKDGMKEFDEKGISNITSFIGEDCKDAYDKLLEMKDAGNEYNNYSGIAEGMDGTVKFIYKINSIKKG